MTLLHQIIALEKSVRQAGELARTQAYHTVQQPKVLSGLSRTYAPADDDGEKLPPETTLVQYRVEALLADITKPLVRMFDLVLTKDTANREASADIVVDGVVIMQDAPATYLLFLQSELIHMRTLVARLPVLDPADEWTLDENTGNYVTPATESVKHKKVLRAHVLYHATDKHPAQVQSYSEDVVAGTWTARKFSGAVPAVRKQQLIDRVDALSEAVQRARAKANTMEVEDRHVGADIFRYLFGQ